MILTILKSLFRRTPQTPFTLNDNHTAGRPVRPLPQSKIERPVYRVITFGSSFAVTNGHTPGLLMPDFARAQKICDDLNANLQVRESEAA